VRAIIGSGLESPFIQPQIKEKSTTYITASGRKSKAPKLLSLDAALELCLLSISTFTPNTPS
jgi:hypothetical protein